MDDAAQIAVMQKLTRMQSETQFREAAEKFFADTHQQDADKFTPEEKEDIIAQIAEILTLFGKINRTSLN
jgi:hypothetical protein